jgi:hypothetical protein
MLGDTRSKLCCRVALLMIACVFVASTWSTAAAASGISVLVDPLTGDDSSCAATFICRTIAYAVEQVGASHVNLSAGVFNESTVNINNAVSLVVNGVASSSFFDCSRRLGQTTGAAFNITNSTVTITGLTFQNCINANANGGAVSAVASSVALSHCCFINCSAANGGAMSATGGRRGLFLRVESSTFIQNSAVGGLIGCPSDTRSSEPCSTWGGAVAAFDMWNVSVVGCTMAKNIAVAAVPSNSPNRGLSRNAVAGGGCVSLLFRGNASTSTLRVINSSFLRCEVDVSSSRNIFVGNGSVHSRESMVFPFASTDACAGYGGALSVYVGLSAGLQLLHVSFFNIALQSNLFANCVVIVSVQGGNVYGGAVSLYIGGYSSMYNTDGDAVAAVGDTVVRNLSVTLDTTRFESCSARRISTEGTTGANVYGGSFSFYIGAYAWSRSETRSSNSTCGGTYTNGIFVSVQNTTSMDSEAFISCTGNLSYGANPYGGSMSVLYVGPYSWSRSDLASSSSKCGATNAIGIRVQVSSSGCSNCRALTTSEGISGGANSYGGSISVLYVGAYSWSFSGHASSSSTCLATFGSGISVHVSSSGCSNCSALTTSGEDSRGANSYGGSMSVLYVGVYSRSWSQVASSSSTCGATFASGVSVHVSSSGCLNCSALTNSMRSSLGANSYGGSMSVLYVGAYSWSMSVDGASSSSTCGVTSARIVSIHVSDVECSNCKALATRRRTSFGSNSYGGSISASHIGAYSYTFSNGQSNAAFCRSSVELTRVLDFSIAIIGAAISDTMALSGEQMAACANVQISYSKTDIYILCLRNGSGFIRCQCEFFVRLPWPQYSITSVCIDLQVYGGAVSVMVGPYVWSYIGFGNSFASSNDTSCVNCSVVMTCPSKISSRTSSRTSGDIFMFMQRPPLFFIQGACELIYNSVYDCMLPSCGLTMCAGFSNGAFVRAAICDIYEIVCALRLRLRCTAAASLSSFILMYGA